MVFTGRIPTLEDRLRQRERPAERPAMYQSWRDLLFLHWRVDPQRIQCTLPPGLYVDVHRGAAYVGAVPFFMCDIRGRMLPALPWVSNFLELNLRTYVYDERGTPGVWFYTLDCNQPLAVWTARTLYHLPYRHARMRARRDPSGAIQYASSLDSPGDPNARSFLVDYHLESATRTAEPGSLEFFLVERYVLFAMDSQRRLFSGRVHHEPYPLCAVRRAEQCGYEFVHEAFVDFDLGIYDRRPDHVCGSPGVTVDVFGLQALPL